MYTINDATLTVSHTAGVFSCYTIRLEAILDFYNKRQRPPEAVDSSRQFAKYKAVGQGDVSGRFFCTDSSVSIPPYTRPIRTTNLPDEQQFSDYSRINFNELAPFMDCYFAPASEIMQQAATFEVPENACAVLYRGGDKVLETIQPSYQAFIARLAAFKQRHPGVTFLIQTDDPILRERAITEVGGQGLSINAPTALDVICRYVANIYVLSKCKYVISTSGNGEFWLRLFRGHNDGSIQWLSPKEYIYGKKNKSFNRNSTEFWVESV